MLKRRSTRSPILCNIWNNLTNLLLEVNGGPAIPQEGVGGSLMTGLFESITCITVRKLTGSKERYPAEERLIEVLDCKLSPSSIKEIVY